MFELNIVRRILSNEVVAYYPAFNHRGMSMDDIYNEQRVETGITAMLEAAQAKGLNLLELKQAAESIAKVVESKLQDRLRDDS